MYTSSLITVSKPVAKRIVYDEANTDVPKPLRGMPDGSGYRDMARSESSAQELVRSASRESRVQKSEKVVVVRKRGNARGVKGLRFYSPDLRIWPNRDPVGEDWNINLYAMCENNPVEAYDELGLWKVTSKSAGQSRRVYRFEEGDTMESLANVVGLDPSEYQKWGRVEKSVMAEKATSVFVSSNTKPGCYVSVPNVWISADLLRGGNWYYDSIMNLGGAIGRAVGTGVFTSSGYKIIKADDIRQLNAAFRASKGDIWGIVVFGHGNEDGRLSMKRGIGVRDQDWTYQSELITGIQAGGYKIASAYMMQCYSAYKGQDSSGNNVDYDAAWRKVAVKFYGYKGFNAFMIDFGSHGKKKRKLRNGRRW